MGRSLNALLSDIAYSPAVMKLVALTGGQRIYAELNVRITKIRLRAGAKKMFKKDNAVGSFSDYKQALEKHWVTYSEYAKKYEFYKKTEEERDEYVSRLKMAYFYWRYAPGAAKAVFRNKLKFLKAFRKFVHREWLYAPDSTFEQFSKMMSSYDCIVKPCGGKLGRGIFKTYKDAQHNDDKKLYESCVRDRMLVEQCVEACEELKAFHPQSLNTLRVVTIANKEKACVLSGVLRTGVGESVVDNTHQGGVSVQVNVEDGVVETDGANMKGERFVSHPDSGIVFKGYKIPKWDKIVETCCEAARLTENPITGWDVVLNNQGEVEFIEANYGPDMDMMQTRYNKGAKKRLFSLIKEYLGIEMK